MYVLRLLLVLGTIMAGSAMEGAVASRHAEGRFRRLSDTGRAQDDDASPMFPRSSVGFFLEQRVQRQQRKVQAGSAPPSPAVLESVLKRFRGSVSDETNEPDETKESEEVNGSEEVNVSEQPDGPEQPDGSEGKQ